MSWIFLQLLLGHNVGLHLYINPVLPRTIIGDIETQIIIDTIQTPLQQESIYIDNGLPTIHKNLPHLALLRH